MVIRLRLASLLILGITALPQLAWAIPEGPDYPSTDWIQREVQNYAKTLEAPIEEVANPDFVLRWQEQSTANMLSLTQRNLADISWNLVSSPLLTALLQALGDPAAATQSLQDTVALLQQDPGKAVALPLNTPVTPLCTSWSQQCTGDPYRYAEASGQDGDNFYNNEAQVIPVVFYDDGCARLSGRVWAPKGSHAGSALPAVVIENGSIEAPETLYWWAAQLLVRNGYVVMTFDPRGQGRSDQQTPTGGQGTNINSAVFWTGLVNAIDFFRSSPQHLYPHNQTCAGTYPTVVANYNPFFDRIDSSRLGLAGHSLGAQGVSIVQGYDAAGAAPWPGLIDKHNPVDVIVAWDGLSTPDASSSPTTDLAHVTARVPAMGHSSEYGIGGTPFLQPPDPEEHKAAFSGWQAAGVPSYEIIIQGSTHFEWSLLPTFPATSWCPDTSKGHCEGGWGNPLAQHYTLAWFDRWLKKPGEIGYADADKRLLADSDWQERYSFYFRSARSFPDRGGLAHACADIRAGCSDTQVSEGSSGTGGSLSSTNSGGGGVFDIGALLMMAVFAARRLVIRLLTRLARR